MPKGFSVDNLLDAQAITLLRSFLLWSACWLLLCPVELMTVAAVSNRTIVAAVYTAGPLSVALQKQGSLPMFHMQRIQASIK